MTLYATKMSIVRVTSRLSHFIGLFTISLVAIIPLITLANELSVVLKIDGMNVVLSPVAIQLFIFGTTYAAIGEMKMSVVVSTGIMFLLYQFFTYDGGEIAHKYIKKNIVEAAQEKIFLHKKQKTQ